jgi:WD40 repeat protein
MLFDRGRELQLLSVRDGRSLCVLQNPAGMVPFETLALFSPDGSLMLTGGAAEGRLQLWRAPTPAARGFEVRQLVTEEKAPVTCAVFSPVPLNGSDAFAVSGDKEGRVYMWSIPSKDQVDKHRIRNVRLDVVGQAVDAGSRQLPVSVNLNNADGRLVDGRPVTIVIEPTRK